MRVAFTVTWRYHAKEANVASLAFTNGAALCRAAGGSRQAEGGFDHLSAAKTPEPIYTAIQACNVCVSPV